jgi:hypothetical protein
MHYPLGISKGWNIIYCNSNHLIRHVEQESTTLYLQLGTMLLGHHRALRFTRRSGYSCAIPTGLIIHKEQNSTTRDLHFGAIVLGRHR